jgi:hypothetical protein
MADLFIDFEWYRASGGYRLASWESLVPAGTNPKSYPSGDCIVANGGEWIPYRPFDHFDMLYSLFAKVRTSGDLLAFIGNFGPLTYFFTGEVGRPEWGDDVSRCLKNAELFRTLLSHKPRPKKLASIFDSEIWARFLRADKQAAERVGETWVPPDPDSYPGELNQLVGTVDLVSDTAKGVRFRIRTDALIGALWYQLGQKLSGAANLRECRHCGEWFEAGFGTGRRADAQFCCDDHRIRFNSLKRTTSG